MSTRRLFFAFWPDDALRRSLEFSRQRLFPLSGRPVDVANLHMTLAFLGGVEADRMSALQSLGGSILPCRLELDRLELWGKQRVLVARATRVPQDVARQVDSLWRQLGRLGFVRDPRPFKPHVTLARDIQSIRAGITWVPVRWTCERPALVESIAVPGGVRYVVVE